MSVVLYSAGNLLAKKRLKQVQLFVEIRIILHPWIFFHPPFSYVRLSDAAQIFPGGNSRRMWNQIFFL